MKTFWILIAGAGVAGAAVFLLRGDFDTAFVLAAIGMVAWFLNYRMQIQAAIAAEDSRQAESIIETKDSHED